MGKLKATKLSDAELDPFSYGDAAKGHILEPYGVKLFNSKSVYPSVEHYDDVIVVKGSIGWSPDAMDIKVDIPDSCVIEASSINPRAGLEIKCYGPSHYYEATRTEDKFKLDERWQCATALYVCDTMDVIHLLMFCPELHEATLFNYTRDELSEELETIATLEDMWTNVSIIDYPSNREVWHVDESIEDMLDYVEE